MGRRKKVNMSSENELNRPAANSGQARETRRSPRRRSSSSHPTRFSNYIFKVLKQVHPQLSMTNKAMKVMDDFMHDIYTRLVAEAAGLVKLTKRSTLSASEFQTATRLILPGELAKHAISDGTKAVSSFLQSRAEDARKSKAGARREKIDAVPSSSTGRIPELVEIEIFGTAPPKPLLDSSREIPIKPSDVEDYMEEDIEADMEESMEDEEAAKDIEAPRQVLFPLRNTSPAQQGGIVPENARATEKVLPNTSSMDDSLLENVNDLVASSVKDMAESFPDNNPTAKYSPPAQSGVNIVEASIPQMLEERGPPTPPTEAESDTSVSSSSVSPERQTTGVLNLVKPLENSEAASDIQEEAARKTQDETTSETPEEAPTARIDSRPLINENVEPNPRVTVHVEVPRSNNPNVILDVAVYDDSDKSSRPDSAGSTVDLSSTSEIDTTTINPNETTSRPVSETSLESEKDSHNVSPTTSPASGEKTQPCQTTVTIRCSKVITTKTTFVHERKEQISEWLSENESCN